MPDWVNTLFDQYVSHLKELRETTARLATVWEKVSSSEALAEHKPSAEKAGDLYRVAADVAATIFAKNAVDTAGSCNCCYIPGWRKLLLQSPKRDAIVEI
eukprot:10242699-Alexandrium_andersonii.AAC.1